MTLDAIVGFRLVTLDPDRLLAFYAALGFTTEAPQPISPAEIALLRLSGGGTRYPMSLGRTRVDLDCYELVGRPYPADADAASPCFQHLALVADDVSSAWARAVAAGATPISRGGPVELPQSAGGVTAVKFRDPEGHPLELIRFPDLVGRGWNGHGVLGIDHSAVVVADVDASVDFYTARGLARQDGTLNHGPTQVALDGLDDVEADVVPLAPVRETPHVELLHYRQPPGAPCGPVAVNDVAATRFVWSGGEPALLRDPDDHLHEVDGG